MICLLCYGIHDQLLTLIFSWLMYVPQTLCISAPAAASGDENTAGISVQLLTDKVMAATQVDPSHFYFVVECKPLRKDQILSPKRNNQTTTIHCHYRNPGGCFIFSLSILTIIFFATIGSVCTCGLSLFIIPLLVPFLFILPCFCL